MSTQNRVALYARVSSQEQAMEGVSIEAQIFALHSYAQSQRWEVMGEYIDAGYSGGTNERPGLKRLILDGRKHNFDIIAVAKLDRYSRNLRLLLNNLHELEQLGIKFVATQESLDTSTPYGKFAIQIMGVIAEFERGRIGERVRDSRRYLTAQGKWAGGRVLYGFRWLPKEQRWETIPEEVKVIRYIYRLYLEEKLGMIPIYLRLNEEGYRTRTGTLWNFSSVHKVLTHPGYTGRHPLGINMPAIIDEATWKKAQRKRERARSVRTNMKKGWLLQGICICGRCGHLLKCRENRRTGERHYVCRGRFKESHPDGGKRCETRWINAQWLEWAVWYKVKEVLGNRDTLAQCVKDAMVRLQEKREQLGTETLDIDHELEDVGKKQERLGIAFADGAINEEVYRSKLHSLKARQATLQKCRQNIDPTSLAELEMLEDRIANVNDILDKGRLTLNEFGIFGAVGDTYTPVGFNAWRETDGILSIGECIEQDTFRIEGTDRVMRGIDAPAGFWDCIDVQEQDNIIKKNMRAILQLFNIRIHVFPDRIEIQGAIPTQVLDISNRRESADVPIIGSAGRHRG
jgi:site-specific DNA recombinase